MANNSVPFDFTVEDLRRWLSYDPETGIFRWNEDRNPSVRHGSIAGTKDKDSPIGICVNGNVRLANRLAWFYMTGEDPLNRDVFHIDGDKHNNRFANLEVHDLSPNKVIKKKYPPSLTGHRGISKTPYDTYCVRWTVDGKVRTFGSRKTLGAAVELRDTFLDALGYDKPD